MAAEWAACRDVSSVSRHSHITPRTDTRGSEATSAAKPGLRFPISEMATMRMAEITALIKRKNNFVSGSWFREINPWEMAAAQVAVKAKAHCDGLLLAYRVS